MKDYFTLDKQNVEDILSLSPMQSGILYHYLLDRENDLYFEQLSLKLAGDMDSLICKQAWEIVVQTNEMLRTVFTWDNLQDPVQIVLKKQELSFYEYDLSALTQKAQKEKLSQIKVEEREIGFDLQTGPLFRIILCKLAIDKYELIICNHHIIYDGWSNGIILKEFFTAYTALDSKTDVRLAPKTRFKEYLKVAAAQNITDGEVFWSNYLAGIENKSHLPGRNRETNKEGEMDSCNFNLSEDFANRIDNFIKDQKLTLGILFNTAWGLLLTKYTNNEPLFGTVVSGRPTELVEIEKMVGLFINTLPVRIRVNREEQIEHLLQEVSQDSRDKLRYIHTPLYKIKQLSRINYEDTLFDTVVVVENYPLTELSTRNGQLQIESYAMRETEKFEIIVAVHAFKGYEIILHYNRAKYTSSGMRQTLDHLVKILEQLIEYPERQVSEILRLTPEEREQVIEKFNATARKYPLHKPVNQLFFEIVDKYPEQMAVRYLDQSLTYQEFATKINKLANFLQEKGVGSDSIVALMLKSSLEMMIGIMAIITAGGAYLPIDPDYPVQRKEFILKDSKTKILLTDTEGAKDLNFNGLVCDLFSKDFTQFSATGVKIVNRSDNLVYMIYTSGSTGQPKGVMIEHRSLTNYIYGVFETYNHDFGPADRCLSVTNISFDVSVSEFFVPLLSGGTLILMQRGQYLDLQDLAEMIQKEEITYAYIPPTVLGGLYNLFKQMDKPLSLNKILVGVEPINDQLLADYLQLKSNIQINNCYGLTETTICSTCYNFTSPDSEGRNVPIGSPMPNVQIYILDSEGEPTPVGVPGEMYIGGVGVARGYLYRDQLTTERFIANPFRSGERLFKTGDLGRYLPDGNIEFLGRMDRQIKLRGYRVELGEIETQLRQYESIEDVVVILNKDNYLVAFLVLKEDIVQAELREFLAARLPEYMLPIFSKIKQIPYTSNGKIDYHQLSKQSVVRLEQIDFGESLTKPETQIVKICKDILGVEEVGIDDNFFSLGGHSLNAMQLTTRVVKDLQVDLPIHQIFDTPILRDIAAYITAAKRAEFYDIASVEKRDYYPVSSAQRRLFLLNQFNNDNTSYNVPKILILHNPINFNKIERVIRQLINRHETLRTSFDFINGEPVQIVHETFEFAIELYPELNTSKEQLLNGDPGIDEQIAKFIRPFDLGKSPLMRIGYIPCGDYSLLIFDVHHIIFDGTSADILISELNQLYADLELADLRVHYKDFTLWQNKYLESAEIKAQQQYWLERFRGEIPVLNMPTDYSRPLTRTFAGKVIYFNLDQKLTAGLKRLTLLHDVTLYMELLSIYNVLLFKYTGQSDLIVGSPIVGRRHEDLQKLIGMFVNTLPLRNHPTKEKSFNQFLQEVKRTAIEAYENQDYQFEMLVEKLDLERDHLRNPLFDTMFVLQNMKMAEIDLGEIILGSYNYINRKSAFDFSLAGEEKNGQIEFYLEYSTEIFKEETMKRFISHYIKIVELVIENPDILLGHLDIIGDEEKKKVLHEFNQTIDPNFVAKTIQQLFEEQVIQTPERTALIHDLQEITYRELNERANRLAHLLRRKGVNRESIVGILLEPSIELITAILGVIKAGGAYLPIDPEYPNNRVLAILNDANASVLLTGEKLSNRIPYTSLKNLNLEDIEPHTTSPRTPIKDFDSLPKPDRTLLDYSRYFNYIGIAPAKNVISLQATRGCPYNCLYCHKIWPKKHVVRSAENIFDEILGCYQAGVRRFVFIDDIFNLDMENSGRLLRMIIENGLDVQLFYSNGLRGDILTPDFIDLMVEAGAVNLDLALESASPRIQKMLRKNVNLERLQANLQYIAARHPHVILEMEMMHGFPTETEEEAMMTFDFVKSIKWLHFPNMNILKIFPNTEIYKLAVENGISPERIERSTHLAFHQLPETLPFPKKFTRQYQAKYMQEYFLLKERLLHVLPVQMKILTEDELVQKYDSYLPVEIRSFADLLHFVGIKEEELQGTKLLREDSYAAPDFNNLIKKYYPVKKPQSTAMRTLLLDLSQWFSEDSGNVMYDVVGEPLGLMYLLTFAQEKLGQKIIGKVAKSRSDFNSYDELKKLINSFQPDLIGIRTLSMYKEFFHKTVTYIRHWGFKLPIIAGGPYATSDYQVMLKDANIDLAVLSEGEITFVELIDAMLKNDKKLPSEEVLAEIDGLAYMKPDTKKLLGTLNREVIFLDRIISELEDEQNTNPEPVNDPQDLFYLISTSGMTGRPKSVMLEHRNFHNLLDFQKKETNIDFSRRVLQFATISFDVSVQEIFSTLTSGGELYLIDRELKKNILKLFKYIAEKAIEIIFFPTAFLKFIAANQEYLERLPGGIKHIITAGEQLVITDGLRDYLQQNQVYLHNHYGPTESHVVTTLTLNPQEEIPAIPSIGKPITNTQMFILDEGELPQPVGIPGELCIAGQSVGRGYINRPELTDQKFVRSILNEQVRMYRTGDLARWLSDGKIEFLGRMDYQVKIRGYRIELGEIESQLLRHEVIKEAVVIDRDDHDGGKYLCAYLVVNYDLPTADIRAYLADNLPEYMIPGYFVIMKKLPHTMSGKLDRQALPEPAGFLKRVSGYEPPTNAVESKLIEFWSQILGVKEIGIIDNFFELGGHSLRGTQLIAKIYQEFGIELSLRDIFRYPTIKVMAEYLKEQESKSYEKIEKVKDREYYPTSSAQKRLFILNQLHPMQTNYNLPGVLWLYGSLDKTEFTRSWAELIERHEILRTSFGLVDSTSEDHGEVVQKVYSDVPLEIDFINMKGEAVEIDQLIKDFVRPFDLSQPPLLRVKLVQIEDEKHLLLVDMHHIISDGASIEILFRDFIGLYDNTELPELQIQYKDFAFWQQRMLKSEIIGGQEAYWLNHLQNVSSTRLPGTELVEIDEFSGKQLDLVIDVGLKEQIDEVCQRHNVTRFSFLLSIFKVLLYQETKQEDLTIGVPVAGRNRTELADLMGLFLNVLPIRTRLQQNSDFAEYLAQVNSVVLDALDNQDYPFDLIYEKLQDKRHQNRDIFSILFNYAPFTVDQLGINEPTVGELPTNKLIWELVDLHNMEAKYDLTLYVLEQIDGLRFRLIYKAERYEEYIMRRLLHDLEYLIELVLADESIPVAEMRLVEEAVHTDQTFEFDDNDDFLV